MREDDNVIPAIFDPDFFEQLYMDIKAHGIKFVHEVLVDAGMHPSFAKAAVRRVIRTRGW